MLEYGCSYVGLLGLAGALARHALRFVTHTVSTPVPPCRRESDPVSGSCERTLRKERFAFTRAGTCVQRNRIVLAQRSGCRLRGGGGGGGGASSSRKCPLPSHRESRSPSISACAPRFRPQILPSVSISPISHSHCMTRWTALLAYIYA